MTIIEFSRPVRIDHIDKGGYKDTISANEDECTRLAKRFDLVAVKSLSANVYIKPKGDGLTYHVKGDLTANIIQQSVVSEQEVSRDITSNIDAYYADKAKVASFLDAKNRKDMENDEQEREVLNESDAPEPIHNGEIDLGEMTAQFLGLALDDYPRAENEAEGTGDYIEATPEETKPNPFAVLQQLKDKK